MVKIRVAPLATKVPNLDLEIDLTESLRTLKVMIEYTYSKKITQCYLQVMVRGCNSYREIPSTDDEKALAALGFVDGSIVCVGGDSSPEEIAQQLIAKHLNNPLKALWEVLCDVTLDVLPVSMAIINAPGCGIEKRTTALDGTLTITSWTFRCRFEIGAGSTPLIMAAHAGRIDVLKALIEAGAQVNSNNPEDKELVRSLLAQKKFSFNFSF